MTDQSIGAARIDLVVDTQQFDSAITAAKRGVADMSSSAQQQYQQLSRAERGRIDTLVRQADTLGMTRSQQLAYNAALKTSGPVLDEIVQKLARAEAAAKRSGKELNAYGVSAAQQAAAMRGVPAQITDIAVSLQGGQNPLTVFLQQGGQLKDMFGGIRPAAAALASQLLAMINPLTVAAAAVAGLGFAWYQAGEQQGAFERALILSGNRAGYSVEQLNQLAQALDGLDGVTRGKAAGALAEVAAGGRFAGEQFEIVTRSALKMNVATGDAIEATAAKFETFKKDPAKALLDLNRAENFLYQAQLDRVVALQAEGKGQEAVTEAMRIYGRVVDERSAEILKSLSLISSAWKEIKDRGGEAWDAIVEGVGRADSSLKGFADRVANMPQVGKDLTTYALAMVNLPLAAAVRLGGNRFGGVSGSVDSSAPFAGTIDSDQAEKAIKERKKAQEEWDRLSGQNLSKRQKQLAEEAKIVALGKKLGKDQADIDREVAASRKQFDEAEARRNRGSKTNPATSIVARIQQQVALNKEQSGSEEKLTVSQRLRVQVLEELDRLGAKIPEADRKRIRTMLEELKTTGDLVEAKDKQKKTLEALTRQQAIFDQQAESRRRGNELDLMSYGRGQDAVAQLRRQMDVQREYEDELKRLGDRKVATDQDQWDQLAANAARHRDEQLQLEMDYQARRLAAMGDWRNGTRAAFEDYATEANNAAGQAHSALTNAFQGAEDALVQFAMTGKLSFRDLANSIIADLARIAAKQAIVGIAGMIASAWGGGVTAAGNAAATSGTQQINSDLLANIGRNANGGVYTSPSLSAYSGGVYSSPQLFAFAKGAGVFGEAGPEAIMPLRRGPDGRLGVAAHGAGSGASQVSVSVVVNSDGSTDVSADTPVWQQIGKQVGQLIDMKINEAQIRSMKDGGAMRVMGSGR
ncbi:phage tail tape measure protein [Stenotrophomonas maltophilia]|uniref:phage tail tape measure protein n=1 Tax=Stenotrophomonas maltophilia TaxID=40324 RepID=UPI003D7E7F42